jgi:predicted esterase
VDPHIPVGRVEETATVLSRMGGVVTKRIYPGMGHTVNRDELDHVGRMMLALSVEASPPQG